MKKILLAVFLLASLFLLKTQVSANLSYAGGDYTNLCGSGLSANGSNCSGNCNPATGTCSSAGNTVVRFVCDGRQTQCNQNESSFSSTQSLGQPGSNKTVAIVVFDKTCRQNGAWTCGDSDMKDYMVWYSNYYSPNTSPSPSPFSTASPYIYPSPTPAPTCASQQQVLIQFQKPNASRWVGGNDFTNQQVTKNDRINVNCFAKTGTALLDGGYIDVRDPNGAVYRVSNSSELRNFQVSLSGNYQFTCRSASISNCTSQDSFNVLNTPVPPVPAPPQQPPVVVPTPLPTPVQVSTCNRLEISGGNNSLVPATVTLRATGSDNKGNIQAYHFYFGDGQQVETNQNEVQHQYTSSGTFIARVDVKDSQGNWKASNSCETNVYVKSAPIESFRSGCSDVYITADNSSRAPSKVTFEVTGFDNKGSLQNYRLDFGNGIVKESTGRTFEQIYNTVGTYDIRAYVKDSQGNWVGGDGSCHRTVVIGSTKPLTSQPSTGTPTMLPVAGAISGVLGLGVQAFKKKLATVPVL